jgi:fluoride exporter
VKVLGIMVGGAMGATARYYLTLWIQGGLRNGALAGFPLATLSVNVVGSFLFAFLTEFGLRGAVSPQMRLALGTGFIGALTTFSTFEVETDALLTGGRFTWAAAYVLGNLVLGFVAVLVGRALAARIAGPA